MGYKKQISWIKNLNFDEDFTLTQHTKDVMKAFYSLVNQTN